MTLVPYSNPLAPELANPYQRAAGYLVDWDAVHRLARELAASPAINDGGSSSRQRNGSPGVP